jgi:hypothetical protein
LPEQRAASFGRICTDISKFVQASSMLLLEVSKALLKRLQTPKHVALGGKVLTGISLFVPLVKLFPA